MALVVEKILKKATPTVRTSDQVVKKWDIEVIYKNTADGWTRAYPHNEDVEWMNKTASQFTKEELIALMPTVTDTVFESHHKTMTTPRTEQRVGDFNLNDLAS
jgi:hypothetical protein